MTQTWGDPAVAWGPPGLRRDLPHSSAGRCCASPICMMGSRPVAEDLTQETFARLYQHFAEINDPTGFLRTTLVRTCVNSSARSSGRRGAPPGQLPLAGEPGPVGQPEIDGMWAALAGVRAGRRVVLVLRSYADLPPGDIASILGCPESTVRTQLHRGLADLRSAAAGGVVARSPTRSPTGVRVALAAKAAQVDTEQLITHRWAEGPELATITPRHDATKPRREPGDRLGGRRHRGRAGDPADRGGHRDRVRARIRFWLGGGCSRSVPAVRSGRGRARPRGGPGLGVPGGRDGLATCPVTQTGFPALAVGGQPEVLFIGEEWCPFCAAERWPLALALSRFGRLGHLQVIASAQDDVYPGTASVGFHGATYDSRWITFVGREVAGSRAPAARRDDPARAVVAPEQRGVGAVHRHRRPLGLARRCGEPGAAGRASPPSTSPGPSPIRRPRSAGRWSQRRTS